MGNVVGEAIERGEYIAHNQGTNITPAKIRVTVVCSTIETVWYRKENDPSIYETTTDRFREIVGNE